ncbi:Tetratricopeptide repeat-containing protein [Parelusimicrobium proximum]|uniref:tetratricopeptide repeat protein n=1 Tax=Parelusimicrobium proximum TaxID=3228953 RepID=UPI003D16B933
MKKNIILAISALLILFSACNNSGTSAYSSASSPSEVAAVINAADDINEKFSTTMVYTDPQYAEAKNADRLAAIREQMDKCAKMVKEHEHNLQALSCAGRLSKYLLEDFTAQAYFRKAAKLTPVTDSDFIARAYAFTELSKISRAEADLQRAYELNPNNPEIYKQRAYINMLEGEYAESIVNMTLAVQLAPDNSDYYSLRASYYLVLQDFGRAIEDFKKAQQLNPSKISNYMLEASVYMMKQNFEAANNMYLSLMEKFPDNDYIRSTQAALGQFLTVSEVPMPENTDE